MKKIIIIGIAATLSTGLVLSQTLRKSDQNAKPKVLEIKKESGEARAVNHSAVGVLGTAD